MTVIHKRNPPLGALCGAALGIGSTASDYWSSVTCDACLAAKPANAGGRTSFKHSYRGEGGDIDDVIG